MKLTITGPGIQHSTEARRLTLRLAGNLVGLLAGGVRRITLRVPPPVTGAPPRASLVLERRAAVTAYQLEGRVLRWALRGAALTHAFLSTPPRLAVATGGDPIGGPR